MKIVMYQKAGRDYPENLKGNEIFKLKTIEIIRRRLELRDQDVVEVVEE